ncbi:hypothetical protein [Dyadobacter sp. NIV53]|uniref:hypothetical protein n=1 Tax=Dyadobacter sp. NIV53 TaxID=2861765 RepID=UPI001C88A6D3|nr:hypothetical protein [Dyadobacter sp. NIV53]
MSNLQKFNETLEEFNQEVEQLKEVSGAYKKLQQLTETYNVISKQFDENSKSLDAINVLQKVQQEKISNSLIEIGNTNNFNRTELAKLFEERTDQIRKENKEFYKDLEGTIRIKLDENKSNIKQLIENERNQIKQIFENELAKNTNELRHFIEAESRILKTSVWIIGGLTLIISLLAIVKLWM